MKILNSTAIVIALSVPAFADPGTTLEVAESDGFGPYLTDAEGRPVYVFSTDTQASEGQPAQISCTSTDCQDAWPLVTTLADPVAGSGVDSELMGMIKNNDQWVVTYHGWPLYYFAHDEGAVPPQGNEAESFGGAWSLVAPDAGNASADTAAGEARYADGCAPCHGRTGRGMASFPSLSGKTAEGISDLLKTYRARERVGANSALMFPVAAGLSDDDIADLAAFISTTFE